MRSRASITVFPSQDPADHAGGLRLASKRGGGRKWSWPNCEIRRRLASFGEGIERWSVRSPASTWPRGSCSLEGGRGPEGKCRVGVALDEHQFGRGSRTPSRNPCKAAQVDVG